MKDIVESQIDQIGRAAKELVRISEEKYNAEKRAREFVEATVTELLGKPDGAGSKVHSLSSAEAFAKKSEFYREFKDTIQQCENALLMAHGAYAMVVLRAKLAVSLVAVGEAV